MPSTDEIYGGSFLSAVVVKSEKLVGKPLTIKTVEAQEIGRGENAKMKLIITFQEIDRQLVLNKTNAGIISESYGDDYSVWKNKKLFLQITKRQFQGQLMDAVSVACENATSSYCYHQYQKNFNGIYECIFCKEKM